MFASACTVFTTSGYAMAFASYLNTVTPDALTGCRDGLTFPGDVFPFSENAVTFSEIVHASEGNGDTTQGDAGAKGE